MESTPFVIERTYDAPANIVWQAITDKNEMQKWYFDLSDFKPEVGFEFQFVADEKKKWLHLCKVTEVIPGKKLTYSWRYGGYPGISFVTWELFPQGDKTKLKLTHVGLESFQPETYSQFKKENFEAGWTHIVGTSLNEYLEKETVK